MKKQFPAARRISPHKGVQTMGLSPLRNGLRVNLSGAGFVLITRDDDGNIVVYVEAAETHELTHYDHEGVRACKVELNRT